MTKIDGRTKEVAMSQIDESLTRLKVDHIDLLQHHEVLRYDDPDRIFSEGGSMEAVLAANRRGRSGSSASQATKIRTSTFIMMDVAQQHRFHFDTVQMPLNIMDAHFRSFSQLVVPQAVKQQIAVLGMKCFGSGVILKSGVVEPIDCLHYSLNLPLSVLITGINTQQLLDQAFAA
jgi:aryl-alcohol dehydrogenase-like predicted oxidoreductase